MGEVNRSPKQGVPVAPQNGDLSPEKIIKKRRRRIWTKKQQEPLLITMIRTAIFLGLLIISLYYDVLSD